MTPEYREIPLEDLTFDPQNPRFPTHVDGEDQNDVLSFMLRDAGLIDLMRSIASQGFFPGEPLLVCPAGGGGTSFQVIEGNRRLAATKLLADPQAAPTKSRSVQTVAGSAKSEVRRLPCLVFEGRNDILKHLGYRHVTGIKEWDPLAKARYLDQRYGESEGESTERFKELARSIGSRSDYVGRLLCSLTIYNFASEHDFFDIAGLTEQSVEFSLISSVLAYSNVVEYLGLESSQDLRSETLNRSHVENIFTWIFRKGPRGRTVLGESRNIRKLSEVIANDNALRLLEQGASLSSAFEQIESSREFLEYVENAHQALVLARGALPNESLDEPAMEAVGRVADLSSRLLADAGRQQAGGGS
ncbi:ParB N-terminal domain-containing protein [Gordonia sp. ABSL11-1]|uniref:ParB N-terminal domain-containing protein n=1 Tax=Gordonia sp. ABSL11-1 TaxID=3053924 RepID=UPI002572A9DA|nr:ParB N-terminal domain-containing protein [Gordonia sp. ABSL11-1]MDL9944597.1 ParB N-terminal domain-containing protein [Gordonia sp. ABSL11-1]